MIMRCSGSSSSSRSSGSSSKNSDSSSISTSGDCSVGDFFHVYTHTHTSYDSCVKLGRKVWKALTVDSNMAPFCNVKLHAGTDSIPDSQLTPCFHCACSF